MALAVASAAAIASTFAGAGLAMAGATTPSGGPATAPRAMVRSPAAASALAITAALRARADGTGGQPGAAAGLGVLTGTVDNTRGRPVAGACVIATGRGAGAMAMTQPDGRYVLGSLRPGSYQLHYSDCSASGRYLDQWSGGASWAGSAATVTVVAGQVRTAGLVTLRSALPSGTAPATALAGASAGPTLAGLTSAELISARVAPGLARAMVAPAAPVTGSARGAIAGVVTGGGKPVKGICVSAFGSRGFGAALTAKNGHYRIGRLQPGHYQVRFLGAPFCAAKTNWLPQWYRGFTSFSPPRKPTEVVVSAGRTTSGIDAAMRAGGEIDGTARSKSGKTLSGVCVAALPTGKSPPPFNFDFGTSARSGSYAIHALFPGKYLVEFTLGCGNKGNYAPQWWRDSATRRHAAAIQVSGGVVVRHVDAAMPPGAALSGVVRAGDSAGQRLSGICVFGFSSTGPFAFATTGKNGRYKLVGMTTGTYHVYFTLCRNRGNHLPLTRSVRVTTGQSVTGFNVFLQPGAIVSGRVTDAHGTPVRGICVQVQGPRSTFAGTITPADGDYSINALPPGSYTVQFAGGCGNAGSYAPQYYNGQANSAAADQVPLIAGQTTGGVDAAMQPGGTITGIVTDNAGHKLSSVCVLLESQAQAQSSPFFFGGSIAFTNKGSFAARNLVPGLYTVSFGCGFGYRNLAQQWFPAQPDSGSADLVSAAPGAITSGINATLQPAGTVTGAVTNHEGKPLPRICILAIPAGSPYPALSSGLGVSSTGGGGHYRIAGLSAGRYDLQFLPCDGGNYGSQWYGGKATEQSSTPVTVRSGRTTAGNSAVMAIGGSISGQAASGPNQPLARICVIAQDTTTESIRSADTGPTGRYLITGLSSGAYQVTFSDCGHTPPRWGSVTRSGAVQVTAPRAETGVNQRLAASGTISGTVDGSSSARPLAQACVVVVPISPKGSYGSAITGNNGTYQVTGLAAGRYQVYFGDPFCPFTSFVFGPFGLLFHGTNLAPQWYSDQATRSAAKQVTVKAAGNTIGIDASLALDGGISGTVTDESHAPVAGECVTAVPASPAPDPLSGQTLDNVLAVTAADGTYALVDLPPGNYQVQFSAGCGDSGFATQWWDDVPSAQTATSVVVPAVATVTGINAVLQH
jgi:Carboxypeptidase regulatory-like domain